MKIKHGDLTIGPYKCILNALTVKENCPIVIKKYGETLPSDIIRHISDNTSDTVFLMGWVCFNQKTLINPTNILS